MNIQIYEGIYERHQKFAAHCWESVAISDWQHKGFLHSVSTPKTNQATQHLHRTWTSAISSGQVTLPNQRIKEPLKVLEGSLASNAVQTSATSSRGMSRFSVSSRVGQMQSVGTRAGHFWRHPHKSSGVANLSKNFEMKTPKSTKMLPFSQKLVL